MRADDDVRGPALDVVVCQCRSMPEILQAEDQEFGKLQKCKRVDVALRLNDADVEIHVRLLAPRMIGAPGPPADAHEPDGIRLQDLP